MQLVFRPDFAKAAGLAVLFLSAFAQAQDGTYPSRPLMLYVPFGAGSTTDIYARVLGEALSEELKQPVVVDNRPGAGGSIGLGMALRAPADGYTMALVTTSTIAINAHLYPKLAYNPAKDVSIVAIPSTTPNVLITPSNTGFKTYAEFEGNMKDGASHFFNSQGSGTSQHLSSVLLTQLSGIKADHVSYKGQEGITGMVGGQTQFAFASIPSVLGLIKGGKINALAITGPKEFSVLPGVPTLVSLGYKPFAQGEVWYGIGVNAKTPEAVKERLSQAVANVARLPKVQAKLVEIGFEPMPEMDAGARQKYVDGQVAFWGQLVKDSGAKAD